MRFWFFFITVLFPAFAFAECVNNTDAVYGRAEFIGEPWNYTWVVDQAWDNEKGDWTQIDPITHSLPVLGEAILIRFDDGSEFTYGADLSYHAKGDNLSTIHSYGYDGQNGPYTAILTKTGEIFLLKPSECEAASWNLAR